MDTQDILKKLKEVKEKAKRRRFTQTWDLIINLKNYDLKRPENRILEYIELPHGRGKKVAVVAIVGPELEKEASQIFDYVIKKDDLAELGRNKRQAKKIARKYEFFVAQADLMPLVGRYLGKYLGPRDKMPNPKAGMIFPPKIDKKGLETLYNRLQKVVRISIKKHITFGVPVGAENMKDEEVAENIKYVLDWLMGRLPMGKNNIDSVYVKLTMSHAVRLM